MAVIISIFDAPAELYDALPVVEEKAGDPADTRWKTLKTESSEVTYFAPRLRAVDVTPDDRATDVGEVRRPSEAPAPGS